MIKAANSDDLAAAKAILKGLKTCYQKTGIAPIFINTSGTGVLADSADGNYVSDTIYDDLNPDQIETLPDTQVHREVDLELIKADKEEIQGPKLIGTNSRARGTRSRSIGWKPVKTTKDFLESIKPEVFEFVRKSEKA